MKKYTFFFVISNTLFTFAHDQLVHLGRAGQNYIVVKGRLRNVIFESSNFANLTLKEDTATGTSALGVLYLVNDTNNVL